MGLRLALALAALLAVAAPAHASLPTVPSGPRPGPDVLYEPPPTAPQLTNAGIWRADPILVSGATSYRDGEFVYQDFLYDDHGARGDRRDPGDPRSGDDTFSAPNGTYTYPTDDRRYAQNAADLVELRVRPLADATAFRITLNTLLDEDAAATTIAIGGDPNVARSYPHGANVSGPAQLFLTVHGSTAELRNAATGSVITPAPTATVDRDRRQIEVRVAHDAWDPRRGTVRLAAGVGLWDAANRRYLEPQGSASETAPGGAQGLDPAPAFFNVAFRTDEPLPAVNTSLSDPAWWRDAKQAAELTAGRMGAFAASVDFAKLAAGTRDDAGVPKDGPLNRILASHWEPAQGVDFRTRECGSATDCEGELLGRLQPYALYVPKKAVPARGYGLTLLLHSLAASYNQFTGSKNQSQLGERGPGSLVMTPAGRGPDGWYWGLAGADTFEVWADVARHYRVDPEWVAISGYSMGGYGTYKLATQFPDLFARANPVVGPPTLGISLSGTDSTSGPQTSTYFMLASLRHVPFLMWVAAQDELVPISGTTAHARRFDELGLRHVFDVFDPAEHLTLAINDEYGPAAAFLGEARVDRDPPRITYVVNPKMNFANRRFVADHAYWVGELRLRDRGGEAPRGEVDVRSEGFGAGDPPPGPTQSGGGALSGGQLPAMPFTEQRRDWGDAPRTPVRNVLHVRARNLSRIAIDVNRARVGCDALLDVDTDGPVRIDLAGCGASATVSRSGRVRARCARTSSFLRARVRRRGRGLRVDARAARGRRYTVSVFRQSAGRRILGNRLVKRFRRRRAPFTWSGRGRGVRDGHYVVRYTSGRDVRRFALRRRRGRWSVRPAYYRRSSCGALPSFKLERPVFGGRRNRALGIAFRVASTSRVSVRVLRGRRTVRRYATRTRRGGVTHRLRLASERRRRGDHKVRITVTRPGSRPVTATLTARRL
jgi:dienelactone hydrolase